MLSSTATNVKTEFPAADQSYTWGIVESKYGKSKKYGEIEYHWRGDVWRRLVGYMKRGKLKATAINFYKGAVIDEVSKTVRLRGEFVRDYVADRHMSLWRAFFGMKDKDIDPKIICSGKKVNLPSIAGDDDSLRFYVNGEDVNALLQEDNDEDHIA